MNYNLTSQDTDLPQIAYQIFHLQAVQKTTLSSPLLLYPYVK